MPDTSSSLGLPYLLPAQAQKHVTHNEALQLLDLVVQLRLRSFEATTPPTVPDPGEAMRLDQARPGDWAGKDGQIAVYSGDSWLFMPPREAGSRHIPTPVRCMSGAPEAGSWRRRTHRT